MKLYIYSENSSETIPKKINKRVNEDSKELQMFALSIYNDIGDFKAKNDQSRVIFSFKNGRYKWGGVS